ncbi:hypothetical protein V1525DRAFT_455937 [Lipomyces kononenkoae]|uniref:Uncharacterized protein n=1 Tax=Lipomyces kononenkoae TaxID=34357 RepID=A0ACC3T450_LIPKO
MESDRAQASGEVPEQHVAEADVLHLQLQQLHPQLQDEGQALQADEVGSTKHIEENAGIHADTVGILGEPEGQLDDSVAQQDKDQDQAVQHDDEDGQIELSEELQMQVAQLVLELQQQGLNLSPDELQEHLMAQIASGQLAIPTTTGEEEAPEIEAEVELEQASEDHHQHIEEATTTTLPSSVLEPMPEPMPEPITNVSLHETPPISAVEQSSLVHEETVVDPALQALSAVHDQSQTLSESLEPQIEPEDKGAEETGAGENAEDTAATTTLEHLNELIMGMDLSDPAAAIAQLQSATNIDPATLLQAVTTALSSLLEGGEEEDEAAGEAEAEEEQLGEDTGPRPRRKRIRKRLPPRNEEERQKLKKENRERKKRWRMLNDERNKDNDLRVRVNRRANRMFGEEKSEKKMQWIENEFARRRQRRLQRVQRSLTAAGGLGNLFGQGGVSEELQAALAEMMDREGDIEKFNDTLLQLARDPNLIKNLTVLLQQMGGIGEEAEDDISEGPDQIEEYTETGTLEEVAPASAERSEQVLTAENIIDPVLLAEELNVERTYQDKQDDVNNQERVTEPVDGNAGVDPNLSVDEQGFDNPYGQEPAGENVDAEVRKSHEQQHADLEAEGRSIQPADVEAAAQAVTSSLGDLGLSGINIDENVLLQAFSTIIANGLFPETSGDGANAISEGDAETIHPTELLDDSENIQPQVTMHDDEKVGHEVTADPESISSSDATRKRARESEGADEHMASRRRTSLSSTLERALPGPPQSSQSPAVTGAISSGPSRLTEPFLPSHFVPIPPPRPAYIVRPSNVPVPSPRPLPHSQPIPAAEGATQPTGSTDDNPDRKKKVKAMGFPPMLRPLVPPRAAEVSSPIPGTQISAQD